MSKLSPQTKKEMAAYQRDYQKRRKSNLTPQKENPNDSLLLRQTNEKVTALFHKIHNLQVEVADLTATIKTANLLWLKILEDSEARRDASYAAAEERQRRIETFTK